MPKIKKNKNKIEQCTKIFIYRDVKRIQTTRNFAYQTSSQCLIIACEARVCVEDKIWRKKGFTVLSSFTFRFPPPPLLLLVFFNLSFLFSPGPGPFNWIALIWVWFESYLLPRGEYSLVWHMRGCAAGQGVVLVRFVLNRVYSFAQDCPKQGDKIEGFFLNRVCISGIFCPKQGQGFKPSAAHLYPNFGQESSSFCLVLVEFPPPPSPLGLSAAQVSIQR